MMSHSLIHLVPAHHSHPPSHIHGFIPGSKLTFSANLFHHDSLLAPTWTAFSDYTGPDLLCSTVFFSFLVIYFILFFILGRAVDQAGLTASFRAHVNIVSLLTYLLTTYVRAVVVVTGYGYSTPKTAGGKMFCMFYALTGIPLNLVMFQSIGERLNIFVTFILKHLKKCFRFKTTEVSDGSSSPFASGLRHSVPPLRNTSVMS